MPSVGLRFVREDRGQDLIEYGLLIGVITLAVINAINFFGPKVAGYFSSLSGELP